MRKRLKVGFADGNLLKAYSVILSFLLGMFLFCTVLIPDRLSLYARLAMLWSLIFLCILIYLSLLLYANCTRHARMHVGINRCNVVVGDIESFSGYKVIGTNDDFSVLGSRSCDFCTRKVKVVSGSSFLCGADGCAYVKSNDYGACLREADRIMMVMRKISDGRAIDITMAEYAALWFRLWKNLELLATAKIDVNIPLYDIRPKGRENLTLQEVLEIALWSLYRSGYTLPSQSVSVNFVVEKSRAGEIDFFGIRFFRFY